MKYLLQFILVIISCNTMAQRSNVPKDKIDSGASISALKWKFYALTFDVPIKKFIDSGTHYKTIEDSMFSPVQCDIRISKTETQGDTIKYYLDFHRQNPNDKYLQRKADFYVGIGFVKRMNIYYPIPGETYINEPLSYYAGFFKKREKLFKEYLKKYSGDISPWLNGELLRRNITK